MEGSCIVAPVSFTSRVTMMPHGELTVPWLIVRSFCSDQMHAPELPRISATARVVTQFFVRPKIAEKNAGCATCTVTSTALLSPVYGPLCGGVLAVTIELTPSFVKPFFAAAALR